MDIDRITGSPVPFDPALSDEEIVVEERLLTGEERDLLEEVYETLIVAELVETGSSPAAAEEEAAREAAWQDRVKAEVLHRLGIEEEDLSDLTDDFPDPDNIRRVMEKICAHLGCSPEYLLNVPLPYRLQQLRVLRGDQAAWLARQFPSYEDC